MAQEPALWLMYVPTLMCDLQVVNKARLQRVAGVARRFIIHGFLLGKALICFDDIYHRSKINSLWRFFR